MSQEKNRNRIAERLVHRKREGAHSSSISGYTRFVRTMRLLLPVIAACLVVVLFLATYGEKDTIVPIKQDDKISEKKIVKNELLNPKFESRDKKDQPYKITATRAVQGEMNKDLIMLEKPIGEIVMHDGVTVTMHSDTGAYRQDTERFYLQGGVFLEHNEGYTIRSEEAHVDLKQNLAWTEKPVTGEGPEFSIAASGVQANGKTGRILFSGPAKLVLSGGFEGMK